MTVATLNTSTFGANVFGVDTGAVSGSGLILPNIRLGTVAWGDAELEAVYCKYTSVSNQVLSPGLLFTVDDDYTATLLTTSNSPRGSKVMACLVGLGGQPQVTTVTGTVYYLWLGRAGQIPCNYTTVATLGNLAETTATGGAANFPNTPTVSSKLIVGLYITKAVGGTFTGTTTNGSTFVSVAPGQITIDSGPCFIGSTLSATGIAASQTVTAFTYNGQNQIIGLTLSAAATASGTVTITNSLNAQARFNWPYIDKTN